MTQASAQRIESAQETAAAATVYEALASSLLNLPSDRILQDIATVARLLSAPACATDTASDNLERRYYDRFFVTSSRWYVPLNESCIRGAFRDLPDQAASGCAQLWRFGPTSDTQTNHVVKCYACAGFDPGALVGFEPATSALRPDSLAAELAFMAYLARSECAAPDSAGAERPRAWQRAFLTGHLACWTAKAAVIMACTERDFYAHVCELAAAWVALDAERLAIA